MSDETRAMLAKLNGPYINFMIGLCALIFFAACAGAAAWSLYQQHGPALSCGWAW